jgi:bifunctional non-homologous end joining protein LigD
MLAETSEPFDSPDFYFEPKWDGMRCIAYIQDHKMELQNRNLTLVTKAYPELESIPNSIATKTAVLDGEIVVLEKGLPSFEDLQKRFGVQDPLQIKMLSKKAPATFIVFDILHLDGKDIVEKPLSFRRDKLASLVEDGPHLLLSQYVTVKGRAYFKRALALGFEGVMAKKSDSPYQVATRSRDWLKVKHVKTLDCLVAGYTKGTGGRSSTFGALVLGAYNRKNRLVHLGNVGTGFSDLNLEKIRKILKPHESKTPTIIGEVKAPSPITWVEPSLVAEIGYMNITKDTNLRMPRFIRFRPDIATSECTIPN